MQAHPLRHTASSHAVPGHGAGAQPVTTASAAERTTQDHGQERQRRQVSDDDTLARTPDTGPSSAADMAESAEAVLDRLREVAAAHDRD